MYPKKVFLLLLLVLILSVAGCWDRKVIENRTFITDLGLESAANHKILYTLAGPNFKDAKVSKAPLGIPASLFRECLQRGSCLTNSTFETEEIQSVLLAEKLARQGVQPLLTELLRNPDFPLQANLIVVEGSPHELLTKLTVTKEQSRSAVFIRQLLERGASRSNLFRRSLGNYQVAVFNPGIDPTLPLLKPIGNKITIAGTALFAKDRMVGKLDLQQTALLMAMLQRLHKAELIFPGFGSAKKTPNFKPGIAIIITKSRRHLDLKLNRQQAELSVSLQLKGNILEYHLDQLAESKNQAKIEKRLAAVINSACRKLIGHLQQTDSDPLGFGELCRTKYDRDWKLGNWPQKYRRAKISIKVHLKIVNYGLVI